MYVCIDKTQASTPPGSLAVYIYLQRSLAFVSPKQSEATDSVHPAEFGVPGSLAIGRLLVIYSNGLFTSWSRFCIFFGKKKGRKKRDLLDSFGGTWHQPCVVDVSCLALRHKVIDHSRSRAR